MILKIPMLRKEVIGVVLGICSLIGLGWGANSYLEMRYALAEELNAIEQRLDYKIKADQLNDVQDRIWKIEDRYGDISKTDQTTREEYRELVEEKERLKEGLKEFGKEKK